MHITLKFAAMFIVLLWYIVLKFVESDVASSAFQLPLVVQLLQA